MASRKKIIISLLVLALSFHEVAPSNNPIKRWSNDPRNLPTEELPQRSWSKKDIEASKKAIRDSIQAERRKNGIVSPVPQQ